MKKELQSSTNPPRNLSGKDGKREGRESVVDQGGAEKKEQMGRKRLSEEFCWGKNWGWEKGESGG